MRVEEVAQELGISKSHAYKVIHELNAELREKGYLTISGRVNRNFFMEKYENKTKHAGRRIRLTYMVVEAPVFEVIG